MQEVRFWFSKRFLVGILAFLGQMNMFSLKANLNMAILDMTSERKIIVGNTSIIYNPEFNWDSKTKGFVLGAFSYGIIFSSVGGYLAWRFGGSTIITISSLISTILTICTPLAIRYNLYLFILFRILEGLCEAFKFVSFSELWTKWSPMRDRSKLMALTLNGMNAGPAFVYPLCGLLIERYGWPTAFYFTGGFSLLWTVIWFFLVPNSPASDKWISKKELNYIQQDLPQSSPTNVILVWKNMLLSKPVYALGIVKFVFNVGLAVVVTCLPMYIKDLTQTRIDEVGIYSGIPTVMNIFTTPVIGFVIDYLRNMDYLNTSQIHKLFVCSSLTLGSVVLFAMVYMSHGIILLMVYLTLFKLAISVTYVVINLNIIALAPKCSSILCSFSLIFYVPASIISPLIIGFIVTDHSLSQWNTCFVTFSITLLFGALIFLVYGSGKPQSWAFSTDQSTQQNDTVSKENKFSD